MKVLIDGLGPRSQPRGVARFIRNLAPRLAQRQLEVWLVVAEWQRSLYAEIERSGVSLVTGRPWSAGRLGRHLWHFVALPRLATELGVDLVHLPDTLPARGGPIPIVATIHDVAEFDLPDAYEPLQARYRRYVVRQQARVASVLTTVSEFTKARLSEVTPAESSAIHVLPEGPGVDPSIPEVEPDPSPRRGFVLFVGALQRNKNVPRLIEAFRLLGAHDLQLVLAGAKHNDAGPVAELIRGDERVLRIESPSDENLAWLYRHAQAVALPSLYEGLGLPILEAFAFSTPAVTSAIGAPAEVADGAAVLVDPWDVTSISEGLARVLGDGDLRRKLVESGQRRLAVYSWDRAATLFEEVYRNAIEGSAYGRGWQRRGLA